jgi:hypothetical protein
LVFATFPEMTIVHHPGLAHSNMDPLSHLARTPKAISPNVEEMLSLESGLAQGDIFQVWSVHLCKDPVSGAYVVTRVQSSHIDKLDLSTG